MSGGMIRLGKPGQMAEAAVRVAQVGDDWHPVLFRWAMTGAGAMLMVPPDARFPKRILAAEKRPLIALLCDDDDAPHGPSRFPQARRLLRWARAIVLHAAGGRPEHYETAVGMAIECGRLVLVETPSGEREAEWLALVKAVAPRTPRLHIAPPPGQTHPALAVPAGATVQ